MLFNTLSNLIVFESMYYSIHNEVKSILIKSISNNNLFTIIINNKNKLNFRVTDKDEFIYNGKMYDIVRQKSEGDTTIYYCFDDNKEDILFANLNIYVKNNMDSNPLKTKAQQILKKITTPLFHEDHIKEQHLDISFCFIYSIVILKPNNTIFDVLTPPPIIV